MELAYRVMESFSSKIGGSGIKCYVLFLSCPAFVTAPCLGSAYNLDMIDNVCETVS